MVANKQAHLRAVQNKSDIVFLSYSYVISLSPTREDEDKESRPLKTKKEQGY